MTRVTLGAPAVVLATGRAVRDEDGVPVWCRVQAPPDHREGDPVWAWGVGVHVTVCGRTVAWGEVVEGPRFPDPVVRDRCPDCERGRRS